MKGRRPCFCDAGRASFCRREAARGRPGWGAATGRGAPRCPSQKPPPQPRSMARTGVASTRAGARSLWDGSEHRAAAIAAEWCPGPCRALPPASATRPLGATPQALSSGGRTRRRPSPPAAQRAVQQLSAEARCRLCTAAGPCLSQAAATLGVSETAPQTQTWHHRTRALLGPGVIDLRIHVELPHLGNMYDGSAPGLASEK
jgi:hypothetical protein